MALCSFACVSCDPRVHWPEVGVCECFIEDGLDAVLAERAHQRVGNGNLVETVDRSRLAHRALPHEHCEPPTLPAELNEFRVCDRAPSLKQLVVCGGAGAGAGVLGGAGGRAGGGGGIGHAPPSRPLAFAKSLVPALLN